MHNENREFDDASIIVRSLTDPKCVKVSINDQKIDYEVEVMLGIELVGDTKVKIQVDDQLDDYNLIVDEESVEKDIDKEVKENYLDK